MGQTAYINMSEAKRAQLAEYWGVNTPLWERYANWFVDLLHGDLGTSLRFNAPVIDVIATRAVNSLALMATAWAVSGVLGFALGILAGANRGRLIDRIVKGYCFLLASVPTFWLGLLFLIVFSVQLGWFPFGFSVPIGVSAADVTFADALHHLALPALTLSVIGVANIGSLNARILEGGGSDLIRIAEALHEKALGNLADRIYERHRDGGARIVLISGPSSSGKTTFAKRLGIQLSILGMRPVLVSLDDYFVDREKTPLDEDGEYDYEALEAIDLDLFNDHLCRLMRGESVDIPRYDFITGRRTWHNNPLTLNERSILIVEGIHGLNPRLTPSVPEAQKFRIYISCFTSVAMDKPLAHRPRPTTACCAASRATIRNAAPMPWRRFRAGAPSAAARRNTSSPTRKNADVMLNSSLFYEISVLRPYAEKDTSARFPDYGYPSTTRRGAC